MIAIGYWGIKLMPQYVNTFWVNSDYIYLHDYIYIQNYVCGFRLHISTWLYLYTKLCMWIFAKIVYESSIEQLWLQRWSNEEEKAFINIKI